MKRARKLAKEMRKEQRRLKREERQAIREEEAARAAKAAESGGLADAIDSLIATAQQAKATADTAGEENQLQDLAGWKTASYPHIAPVDMPAEPKLAAELEELQAEQDKEKPEETLPLVMPHDPLNPLDAAYDLKAYEILRKFRKRSRHLMSKIAAEEPEWDHMGYLRRSPSPCRLRTNGTMAPTRKLAWRSRAGGVYLPPEAIDEDRRGSPSISPAKWMYPEEFKKREPKVARRSPSYQPFQREPMSSSSSSSSSSSEDSSGQNLVPRGKGGPRRRERKSRESSSSRSERASPVYEPEEHPRPEKRKQRQVSPSPAEQDGSAPSRPKERLADILDRLQWTSALSGSIPRERAPMIEVEGSEELEVSEEEPEAEELQAEQEEEEVKEQHEEDRGPEEEKGLQLQGEMPAEERRSESPPTWLPMTPPEEERVGCWVSTDIEDPGQGRPVRLRTPSPVVEKKGRVPPSQAQTGEGRQEQAAQPETVELVE